MHMHINYMRGWINTYTYLVSTLSKLNLIIQKRPFSQCYTIGALGAF
jgi:hypothetical protein